VADKAEVRAEVSCFFRQDGMAYDSATAACSAAMSVAVLLGWMPPAGEAELAMRVPAGAVILGLEDLARKNLDDVARPADVDRMPGCQPDGHAVPGSVTADAASESVVTAPVVAAAEAGSDGVGDDSVGVAADGELARLLANAECGVDGKWAA
jgi:hypothetical protein